VDNPAARHAGVGRGDDRAGAETSATGAKLVKLTLICGPTMGRRGPGDADFSARGGSCLGLRACVALSRGSIPIRERSLNRTRKSISPRRGKVMPRERRDFLDKAAAAMQPAGAGGGGAARADAQAANFSEVAADGHPKARAAAHTSARRWNGRGRGRTLTNDGADRLKSAWEWYSWPNRSPRPPSVALKIINAGHGPNR